MKTLLMAIALIGSTVAADAATYSVEFTFTNAPGTAGSATVAGIARGLTLGGHSNATSVEVLSFVNSSGSITYGVGEYVLPGAARLNNWYLDALGNITQVNFISNTGLADTPPSPAYALSMSTTNYPFGAPGAGIKQDVDFGSEAIWIGSGVGLSFSQAVEEVAPDTGSPSAVPLPAAGWMLLGGLAGIAALRRRKAA